jgi:hypothetical protein
MRLRSRIVTRVIALLLVGAIINVGLAWGLNLMPYSGARPSYSHLPDEDDLEWWRTRAPPGFPAQPAGVYETYLFGRQRVLMYEREADANSNTLGDNVGRFRYGWPSSSMESALWVNRKTRSVVEQHRSYVPPGWPLAGRWVSVEPLWPGFAINTLFYAVIVWMLFAAPFALRRRRRIKRGLCPACAYPVGDSAVCTECGRTLASPSR